MWSDKNRGRWDGFSKRRNGLWEKPGSTRRGGRWTSSSDSNSRPSASYTGTTTLSRVIRGVHRRLHHFLHTFGCHWTSGAQWLWVVSSTPPSLIIVSYIFRGYLHYRGHLNFVIHIAYWFFPSPCPLLLKSIMDWWQFEEHFGCVGHVVDLLGEYCDLYHPRMVDLIMV